jgi:hypothetical protein
VTIPHHMKLDISACQKRIPAGCRTWSAWNRTPPTTPRPGTCAHINMANWHRICSAWTPLPRPAVPHAAHTAVRAAGETTRANNPTDFTDITSSTDYPLQGP